MSSETSIDKLATPSKLLPFDMSSKDRKTDQTEMTVGVTSVQDEEQDARDEYSGEVVSLNTSDNSDPIRYRISPGARACCAPVLPEPVVPHHNLNLL